jgi:hypothetical protein
MADQLEGITSRGQLVPLVFAQDAVAASQTNVQLNAQEVASGAALAVESYTMPFAGQVVGVSFTLSAAAAAGVATVGATVAGTEDADTTLTIGTSAGTYKRVPRGSARFVAGASIGCELSTDGDWDATTSDLVVVIWVLLEMEGI